MTKVPQILLSIALGMTLCGVTLDASAAKGDPKVKPAKKESKPKATTVPEISGQQAGAGLALVLGGAAVVLGRRRKPKLA